MRSRAQTRMVVWRVSRKEMEHKLGIMMVEGGREVSCDEMMRSTNFATLFE